MELFEVIRRGYAAGETIQGLSKKHGVHRRMVRQALGSAIPPERKAVVREAPRLGPVKEHIDGCWPRMYKRRASSGIRLIGSGCAYAASIRIIPSGKRPCGAMCSVRKRELGLSGREVFVPQSYELGQEAQVDWFEGMAKLGGEVVQAAVLRDAQHGRRATPSIGPIRTPRNKLCLKPTSMRSPTLAAFSRRCATTT